MKRHRTILMVSTAMLIFVFPLRAATGPTADIPELQALNHWVGNWDLQIVVKPNAGLRQGAQTRGRAVSEWSADGHALHQEWSIDLGDGSKKLSGTNVITYDPGAKVFWSKTTLSTGAVSHTRGVWDERTRAMTWSSEDPRSRVTLASKSIVSDSGTISDTTVMKDRKGRIILEWSNTATQRAD